MTEIVITAETEKVLQMFRNKQDQLIDALIEAGESTGKEAERLFKGATRTWTHKPNFTTEIDITSNGIEVLIGTDDQPFNFLDKGTRVRRALMSPGWVSKTSPGSLQSGPGGGHVVFISRRLSLPGIKPRNFSQQVKRIMDREALNILNRKLKQWVRR